MSAQISQVLQVVWDFPLVKLLGVRAPKARSGSLTVNPGFDLH